MAKKPHNNIEPEVKPQNTYYDDSYLDTYSFKRVHTNPEFKDRLASELVEWAVNNKEAFKLSQFYIKKRIFSDDLYRWMRDHEGLRAAHHTALRALGDRREIGALKKKYEPSIVKQTLHHYDPEYKQDHHDELALKAKLGLETTQPSNIIIEIPEFKDKNED